MDLCVHIWNMDTVCPYMEKIWKYGRGPPLSLLLSSIVYNNSLVEVNQAIMSLKNNSILVFQVVFQPIYTPTFCQIVKI